MKLSAWRWLLWSELRSQPGRAALIVFAATVSAAIAAFVFGILGYIQEEVRPEIRSLFPESRLIVRQPDLDISILRFNFGRIDDRIVDQVRAIEGVEAVYPQMAAQFPASATVTIGSLGDGLATDVVIHGVPPELVAQDLPPGTDWTWEPDSGESVPIAVSAYFLDLYNLGLAEGAGLPKLSEAAAIGRVFDLELGASTMGLASAGKPRTIKGKVVGLTRNPLVVGLAAPLETVAAWNEEFAPRKAGAYKILHVDATGPEEALAVQTAIGEMGLRAELASENLDKVVRYVTAAEWALRVAVALILALAAVGIVTTVGAAMRDRVAVWGLHRATGLSPGRLLAVVLMQSLLMAAVAAAIGGGIYLLVMGQLDAAFGETLAQVATIPGEPFAPRPSALATMAGLTVLLVALPAVAFAAPTLLREPVKLLNQRDL
ncbi:MAG: FtsX-like permease family protein [Sumerlaeia bacterium]